MLIYVCGASQGPGYLRPHLSHACMHRSSRIDFRSQQHSGARPPHKPHPWATCVQGVSCASHSARGQPHYTRCASLVQPAAHLSAHSVVPVGASRGASASRPQRTPAWPPQTSSLSVDSSASSSSSSSSASSGSSSTSTSGASSASGSTLRSLATTRATRSPKSCASSGMS